MDEVFSGSQKFHGAIMKLRLSYKSEIYFDRVLHILETRQ